MASKTIREAIAQAFYLQEKAGGMNQTALGKRIGKTSQSVSLYLSGDREMKESRILSICRALGIRWQDLDVDTGVTRDPRLNNLRGMVERLSTAPTWKIERLEALFELCAGWDQEEPKEVVTPRKR